MIISTLIVRENSLWKGPYRMDWQIAPYISDVSIPYLCERYFPKEDEYDPAIATKKEELCAVVSPVLLGLPEKMVRQTLAICWHVSRSFLSFSYHLGFMVGFMAACLCYMQDFSAELLIIFPKKFCRDRPTFRFRVQYRIRLPFENIFRKEKESRHKIYMALFVNPFFKALFKVSFLGQ